MKSSPCVGSHCSSSPPGSWKCRSKTTLFTRASVHSECLSTSPFVGSLETKYASARSGEWDFCFLPSWTCTLSLSKFWENKISLGFQKYLSWSFGRIPAWWESTISKKAGNKSPEDTDAPSNCITPVAKGRPGLSVAFLLVGPLQENTCLAVFQEESVKSSGNCNALISITKQINTQWPHQRAGEMVN